jgi:uncharacterized protein (DUF2147 family)
MKKKSRNMERLKASKTARKVFLLLTCFAGLGLLSVQAQTGIEGKWKDHKNGGTILIYEENGLYFGQLIASDIPEENEKIQAHEKIVLLKDFEKKSDTKFCCGTIYQPKKKITLSATLILEDENTLKINGRYGVFKGSQVWTRL